MSDTTYTPAIAPDTPVRVRTRRREGELVFDWTEHYGTTTGDPLQPGDDRVAVKIHSGAVVLYQVDGRDERVAPLRWDSNYAIIESNDRLGEFVTVLVDLEELERRGDLGEILDELGLPNVGQAPLEGQVLVDVGYEFDDVPGTVTVREWAESRARTRRSLDPTPWSADQFEDVVLAIMDSDEAIALLERGELRPEPDDQPGRGSDWHELPQRATPLSEQGGPVDPRLGPDVDERPARTQEQGVGAVLREEKRTLGDLSTLELVESARREVGGLGNTLEALELGARAGLVKAYVGSISARLIIAENKLRELEAKR